MWHLVPFVLSATIVAAVTCPDGWDEAGGSCYMISKKKYDFDGCSEACYPGGLACIQNKAENSYLARGLRSGTVGHFIGFTDQTTESSWEWLECKDNSFTQWSEDEPNDFDGAEDCAAMMGDENPWGNENTCGTWNDVGCSDLEWHCACEYNPDGVLFSESAATLENREKKAKESGSSHGLYSGFAGIFAFLAICCALVVVFTGCKNGCPSVLPFIPTLVILVGFFFCMIGAALTASYWEQTKDFYGNGKLPCERADKALITAGFVITIMGYVALGVGVCVGVLVCFKPVSTKTRTPQYQGRSSRQQVSAAAEQELGRTRLESGVRAEEPICVVQATVVSSSRSNASSIQGTALNGGNAQAPPSLTDKLRDLEAAHTNGFLSDKEHASAKADLIQGFT